MAKIYDIAKLTLTQLATIYNNVAENPIKKFADRATAEKRTTTALAAAGRILVEDGQGGWKIAEVGVKAATRVGSGRHSEAFPEGYAITVLAATNPKKAGTAAAARFALYKTGMTVGEYRAAVKAAFPGFDCLRDLRFDTERGYVSVAPAKKTPKAN